MEYQVPEPYRPYVKREKTFFGFPTFTPLDLFEPPFARVEQLVESQFALLLSHLGLPPDIYTKFRADIRNNRPAGDDNETQWRDKLKEMMTNHPEFEKRKEQLLMDRAKSAAMRLSEKMNLFLEEEQICLLDYGCGQGLIATELVRLGQLSITEIQLRDLKKILHPTVNDMLVNNLQQVPVYFDLVEHETHDVTRGSRPNLALLHTVLHHDEAPIDVLTRCIDHFSRQPGWIMVVESCIGVREEHLLNWPKHRLKNNSWNKAFYELNTDEQIMYSIFFDWIYSKILNDNIAIPCVFNSPEGWKKVLNKRDDLELKEYYLEGLTHVCSPSFHAVFFLRYLGNQS